MRKLFTVLDTKPDLSMPPAQNALKVATTLPRGIEFRNVHFAYPDGTSVLTGVSFHVRPGEVVASVGENGAGKTPVVKLLARFYDPGEGSILIDCQELKRYDLEAWRHSLSVVFQDFGRF